MLLVLHLLISLLLLLSVFPYFDKYKIPINIHTIPIILLSMLGVAVLEYLCITQFKACLPCGLFFGIILVLLQSSDIALKQFGWSSKILSFILMTFFWPEICAFLIFHFVCVPIDEQQSKY